jgi:RsiW-degrading membrane proteinase PrsW (M82 family)
MPLPSPQDFVRLSRDRNALLKGSLMLVAVSLVIALLVSKLDLGIMAPFAANRPESPAEAISLIRFGQPLPAEPGGVTCFDLVKEPGESIFAEEIEALLEDFATDPASPILRIWWEGLVTKDYPAAIAKLSSLPSDLRHHRECRGDLHFLSGDGAAALADYRAEAAAFPAASYARRSAVALARFEEDRTAMAELLADATVREAIDPAALVAEQAWMGDYGGMVSSILRIEKNLLLSPFAIPALFTAAIWFFILVSFRSGWKKFTGPALLAFFLGLASATLTLYAVMVQEEIRGFESGPADPALEQFLYYLAGVSLREELLKLLCFLPLALWMGRRGTSLDALLLGGLVGLGFAFQENLSYFRADASTYTAWLRLLTANVLHFSLTGIAGHALWRMISRGGRGWEEFLVTFLAVVFAHGCYNSLIAIPAFAEYAVLSPIVIAAIAYQYFDPLRQHLDIAGLHRRISPLGLFVIGSALLCCAILISSAAGMPFRFAAGALASTLAAMIPLAFAFISRFRDL